MIPVDRSNCSSFGIFIFTIAIKLYLLARNIGDSLYEQKLIEIITVRHAQLRNTPTPDTAR